MEDVGLEEVACGSDHRKATKCEGAIPRGPLNPNFLHPMNEVWCPQRGSQGTHEETHIPSSELLNPSGVLVLPAQGCPSALLGNDAYAPPASVLYQLLSSPYSELGNKFMGLGHLNKNDTLFCAVSVSFVKGSMGYFGSNNCVFFSHLKWSIFIFLKPLPCERT